MFLYLGHIIYQRIQKGGLANKYGTNEKFSLQMRMLKSLAFVPHEEIKDYFNALRDQFCESGFKINNDGFIKTIFVPQN